MATDDVVTVDRGPRQVARSAVVDADAAELFDQLADPRRHGDLDGSGTVLGAVSSPDRLGLGDKFTVSMRMYGFPYRITSRVTAFEEGRLIEWRHPFGHRWRWEFEPEAATGGTAAPEAGAGTASPRTRVTEVFDYSSAGLAKMLELTGFPAKNGEGITSTLSMLQSRYR
ncbi:SRPBCC family protein [Rhodococcus tukisamuensis]|uniref:Polyketide cyclase / dehydrase and lipid transport n=1 Tax=Rhodococcus tukisamuensis TaxID=168276 RepID=A0A1G6YXV3_9NOCA|nr:SRPBCC family protein [Rhodococcus tukisamuensis]SDD95334.1 Polyketide cyclase / dehydrase and lipid transport [Rhodococcus tukisamuensis]